MQGVISVQCLKLCGEGIASCIPLQTKADMATLAAQGINSFKFFMAYKVGQA